MLVRSEGLPNSDAGMRFATTTTNLQSHCVPSVPKRTLFDGSQLCSRGFLVDAIEHFKVPGHACHKRLNSCRHMLPNRGPGHLGDSALDLQPSCTISALCQQHEPTQAPRTAIPAVKSNRWHSLTWGTALVPCVPGPSYTSAAH